MTHADRIKNILVNLDNAKPYIMAETAWAEDEYPADRKSEDYAAANRYIDIALLHFEGFVKAWKAYERNLAKQHPEIYNKVIKGVRDSMKIEKEESNEEGE